MAKFDDPEWVHTFLKILQKRKMVYIDSLKGAKYDLLELGGGDDRGDDVDLAKAKKRIGDKVCIIVGFDQLHFFQDCTEEETRAELRRCFEAADEGGGFILSPSDHFFDADLNLIQAFSEEARKCVY